MKRMYLFLLCSPVMLDAYAAFPSNAAVQSCLAAQSTSPSITWQDLPTSEIYSEDDYIDGFDASYYIIAEGKEIGYAEKGELKAVLYDRIVYPIKLAQAIPGFEVRPTELDPFSAAWGTVSDASGKYLCISFPFGVLGQSGSFQTNRSAYLLDLGSGHTQRVLFYASRNITANKSTAPAHP
jgi:hypothetical protein